jgi:uncharacterized protein YdeI (YjbR/CyaY-like superfamily)
LRSRGAFAIGPAEATIAIVNVVHFRSSAEFRAWLSLHHATEKELFVGFWRKDSGQGGISYLEALDEALCFGWIDGVRRKVDAQSYTNRFSPRKPRSHWSAVNLRRIAELIRLRRVAPAGLATYAARDPRQTGRASYEQTSVEFPPNLQRRFQRQRRAWAFFSQQAPWYRRTATWWVISAKREETRLRRFETLLADSAAGRRLSLLTPKTKRFERSPGG